MVYHRIVKLLLSTHLL